MTASPPRVRYDRGIDRRDRERGRRGKHESDRDAPHFEYDQQGEAWIGKCPRGLSDDQIQAALDEAIPEFRVEDPEPDTLPEALYAVIKGVPFTTRWTNPEARTVHGFPWMFRTPGGMPRRIKRLLEERAASQGHLEQFRDWMRRYGRAPLEKPRP